jgi:hypothetical protein
VEDFDFHRRRSRQLNDVDGGEMTGQDCVLCAIDLLGYRLYWLSAIGSLRMIPIGKAVARSSCKHLKYMFHVSRVTAVMSQRHNSQHRHVGKPTDTS